jgi:predicted metalloprotease with PDZ domain
VLPYRFSLVSEAEYLKRINAKLTEYYTNPLRLTSNRDAQDNAWTSPNLQTLAYTRGMLYFLQLDAQIRRASNHMKCVDDLVLKLLAERRNNQQHGITAWKALVWSVLGHNALEEFDAMNRGELIRLPAYTFGPEIGLTRVERRELDFGFDVSSFFRKVVVGLKDGSEAARAGIQEKDAIVWNTYVWQCQGDYERWMVVDTSRPEGGELKRLEFWPRSELLVESWIVSKECKSLEGSRVEERIPDDWEWIDLIDVLDGPIF